MTTIPSDVAISVVTSTYNRAPLLRRCYESLCRQTDKRLEWIIIDDDSDDDTQKVVFEMMDSPQAADDGAMSGKALDDVFFITYMRQPHGGKHRALNRAAKMARGKLFLVLDSDDYLADNAVETIMKHYDDIADDSRFGGVGALKALFNGRVVSRRGLDGTYMDASYRFLRYNLLRRGDMCEVYRTEIIRAFPYPEIEGEFFAPEALAWNSMSEHYMLRYVNQIVYYCEYLEGGLTDHIVEVRMKSPVAAMIHYSELAGYDVPFSQKIKAAINYYRFAVCRDRKTRVRGSYQGRTLSRPPKIAWYWRWTRPLGWLMHLRDLKHLRR